MKTIKFEIEVDLTNAAVIAAVNTLFLAIGGHSTAATTVHSYVAGLPENFTGDELKKTESEKPTRITKKVKEVPQADPEKEKAKEVSAEIKEEKTVEEPETVELIEEETPEPKTAKIDLSKVREALGLKVGDHREKIKAKLTELGANNVTTLSPDHYETMYNFLTEL